MREEEFTKTSDQEDNETSEMPRPYVKHQHFVEIRSDPSTHAESMVPSISALAASYSR